MQFSIKLFLILFLISAIFASTAYAHRLNIHAYVKDGAIYVESYYSTNAKCRNCIVEVFEGESRKKIIEGATDENGMFSFKVKTASPLRIIVNDRMGHRSVYNMDIKEVIEGLKN